MRLVCALPGSSLTLLSRPPPPPFPQATPIPLPPTAVFVVSNTLEPSPKAVESEKRYNKRVTEGKLAAKLVAKGLGLPQWARIATFRGLMEAMKLPSPGGLLPAIEKFLGAEAYSPEDAREAAAVASLEELFEGDDKRAGALRVLASIGASEKAFELRKRARHVCSEAERVFQLQAACEGGGSGEGGVAAQLARMGELLTASHASCRDDYECSSAGLDELTTLALASGALGSRLTGAGWGGCAVSLVERSKLPAFLAAMEAGYYAPRSCSGAALASALFASAPGSGAAVYLPMAQDEL
jgi:N-acetylgalactosamine kinase